MIHRAIGGTILLAAIAGCQAPETIPTYAQKPADESLQLMRSRAAAVHDISGQGRITLTSPNGQSVILDAAFVFAPPDQARVRAWKFGQAVLDLTVTRDEAWLFLARQDDHAEQLKMTSAQTAKALRQGLLLLSGQIDDAAASAEADGGQIVVQRPAENGGLVVCRIDRKTLTPRQYVLKNRAGQKELTLNMTSYQVAGPTVWPMVITAESGSGTVRIDLSDIQVDAAPAAAFRHPARAERLQ